ncbi:MAG: glutamate-5-semialdehyde dehydrogenase [Oscillospiraceae bacterium]|nr:glutamate-5-semialdehyde dehydrogenase [Oscillospiraceae bacterium]
MTALEQMGQRAKEASRALNSLQEKKNDGLLAIAKALRERMAEILAHNETDLQNGKANGMTDSLMDRLRLTPERITGMAHGVEQIAGMTDPVGEVLEGKRLPNGLRIEKVRVPLGVIGIIYEARPNVTADAAALCLKAGNTVILRGGKEAFHSNQCITTVMREAIESVGLPSDCIQLVQDTSRESARELMGLTAYLDVLIPRGGAGLIRSVVENSRVPVIQTGAGNCHVYVDAYADVDMAANIIFNAKTQRPSVCNAIETILVHKDIAERALPVIAAKLKEKNVELRGCEKTRAILPEAKPATEDDWATEYLDYILAVKVVDSIEEAMEHIARYSTGHSECIVTENYTNANRFTEQVDCAAVYVNASTRFTDGGAFGMGAEIGISTQKLHARGPMGLAQLTSTKFIVRGSGQIRA